MYQLEFATAKQKFYLNPFVRLRPRLTDLDAA